MRLCLELSRGGDDGDKLVGGFETSERVGWEWDGQTRSGKLMDGLVVVGMTYDDGTGGVLAYYLSACV